MGNLPKGGFSLKMLATAFFIRSKFFKAFIFLKAARLIALPSV